MQEEFPGTSRLVVVAVTVAVGTDMGIQQPGLTLANLAVAVLEVAAPFPDRLHFCAGKRDAALYCLKYVEVMVGFAICSHYLLVSHKTGTRLAQFLGWKPDSADS
jgi:hypothetical protein